MLLLGIWKTESICIVSMHAFADKNFTFIKCTGCPKKNPVSVWGARSGLCFNMLLLIATFTNYCFMSPCLISTSWSELHWNVDIAAMRWALCDVSGGGIHWAPTACCAGARAPLVFCCPGRGCSEWWRGDNVSVMTRPRPATQSSEARLGTTVPPCPALWTSLSTLYNDDVFSL